MTNKQMNTKDNFVLVLLQCKNTVREEAEIIAKEYNNDLIQFIKDCGGGQEHIEECKQYLIHANRK